MDQIPNDGLVNTSVFGDGQHLAFDDTLFPAASDQAFNDASWGLHASAYQPASRAASTHNAPSWPQPASHIATSNTPTNFHAQPNVYGHSPLHSPASFAQTNNYAAFGNPNFNNFNQQQAYPQHITQQNINPAFQQQHQHQQHPQQQQQQQQPQQPQQPQQYNIASSSLAAASPPTLAPVDQKRASVSHERPQANFTPSALPQKQSITPVAQGHPAADQNALMQAVPVSEQNGRFSTIDFSTLVKATNSERLTMFANMGKQPHEFPVNRSTALPAYTKRSSRNELKRQAKDNPKLLAKLGSKTSLSDRTSTTQSRPTNAASPAQSAHSNDGIKYESDSDSASDSDVSLYSDEEDDDLAGAPLPSKRPEESAKGAVEYDTIKALWRNKRKTIDASSIRKGLGDFWEVAKTIRDRWKTDTQAVLDAEAKKRVGDLALLKGRVKDQRDMLEVAFRTALRHGFRGIIELFSENQSFLYLCYQFLLDRFKAEDVNGPVSRLILEILSLTTSITEDKLDKTFLGKILPRYVKGGDAKTKYYAKKVVDGATANSKGNQTKSAAEPSAGVKRSSTAAGNAAPAAPAKKAAVSVAATNGNKVTPKSLATVKKSVDSTKSATTAAPTAATKTKVVQAKPSGFFNGLQTVGKKPGTAISDRTTAKPTAQRAAAAPVKPAFNLAAELANLAKPKEEPKKAEPKPDATRDNESPERKAKRAARLARGAAGVRWKEAQDLVEVRYFSHDPAEELDHDASQMRDVKDVGGEGRMLKQHADMMDVDEEEDVVEDDNTKFVAFNTPSDIDFSTVDKDERDRQYAPYGGGKLQPDSPERAIREQYERDNLIVIYSSPSDIPPNPREPIDPSNEAQGEPPKEFGVPPEMFAARARQRNAKKIAHMPVPIMPSQATAGPAPAFDIAAFSQYMAAQQVPLPTQQLPAPLPVQQQQPAAPFDLTAIFKQFQPQAAAPPQDQQPLYTFQQPSYPQPQQQAPASRPNGEPDISAILAALNTSNTSQAAPAAAPPAFQFPPNFPMPFVAPPEQYQQQPAQQLQTGGNGNGKEKPRPENPWYKTKACKYWQDGKCKKGESCSYLHE